MNKQSRSLLPPLESEAQIEAAMAAPSKALVEELGQVEGDLAVLGAGGKMGPTLAMLAVNAFRQAGRRGKVLAVARFSEDGLEARLAHAGAVPFRCDLLDREALGRLPDAPQVVFMAGRKFGSTGDESMTWAMNAHMPALVAERFRSARIVVFSTGNVYPFSPAGGGGAVEGAAPSPVGEYAQSCLARERIFEHFSRKFGTLVTIIRLNYAIDLRYGVLLDVAEKVLASRPVNLAMGHVNVMWQGDANTYALRSFRLASNPPAVLNVAGPEALSVRSIADRFGERLGKPPVFEGEEQPTALLSNASRCMAEFGRPSISVDQMIDWIASWVRAGGRTLAKPTHYEVRDGRF